MTCSKVLKPQLQRNLIMIFYETIVHRSCVATSKASLQRFYLHSNDSLLRLNVTCTSRTYEDIPLNAIITFLFYKIGHDKNDLSVQQSVNNQLLDLFVTQESNQNPIQSENYL